jgi:UDP-N-acetylglucosamine--N-acetylmuramyl-(pentapeptide) pyrophosphoryl-undecaprenol N-acetylglucosamine transferase
MAEAGAAVVVPDAGLTPERLRREVDAIALDPDRLRGLGAASAQLARPDAARDIAGEVLAAVRAGRGASAPRP